MPRVPERRWGTPRRLRRHRRVLRQSALQLPHRRHRHHRRRLPLLLTDRRRPPDAITRRRRRGGQAAVDGDVVGAVVGERGAPTCRPSVTSTAKPAAAAISSSCVGRRPADRPRSQADAARLGDLDELTARRVCSSARCSRHREHDVVDAHRPHRRPAGAADHLADRARTPRRRTTRPAPKRSPRPPRSSARCAPRQQVEDACCRRRRRRRTARSGGRRPCRRRTTVTEPAGIAARRADRASPRWCRCRSPRARLRRAGRPAGRCRRRVRARVPPGPARSAIVRDRRRRRR